MKLTLTEEQAEAITFDEIDDPSFTVVEDGVWEDQGRHQHQAIIFKHNELNYRLFVSRSGSHYTDFDYQYELDCLEVLQVDVVVTEWAVRR